jgi:hypothetical protein
VIQNNNTLLEENKASNQFEFLKKKYSKTINLIQNLKFPEFENDFKKGDDNIKDILYTVKTVNNLMSNKFKNIVLKSDTQGFDAKILSRIPPKAWSSINSAVIEVWALPEVELSDVERLIGIWRDLAKFKFYSSSNTSIELTLEEIELLWGSKSGKSMNLRLVSSGLD